MFRAWIVWALGALFMCYKNAIEVSPSVMASCLMKEFGLTGAQMGHLAACYFYAYLVFQIPAGLLIDRWGPRRVTTIAMVTCAFGTLLFSFSDSLLLAYAGRFLTGIGASFAAINCLKLIANWFPGRMFALMVGLMMTIGMLGAVGGQAPLATFIASAGWREALYILALGGFALALLFFAVVRNHPQAQEDPVYTKPQVFQNLKKILSSPQAWALSLYSGFAFAPVSAFGGLWGVPFLGQAYGLSPAAAAQGSSLIFLGFAAGAPFFGWLSDRMRSRKTVMFWGTLLAALSLVLVLYFPQFAAPILSPLLFLFGFAISAFLLCFTMIKESFSAALAATSVAFMNAFDALFGAFSDPLTGKVLDLWWTGDVVDGVRIFSLTAYHYALLILVVYFVFSLFSLKAVRETTPKLAKSRS